MAKDQAWLLMVIVVHTWLVEADTTISDHFLWAEMEIILFIHFYPPKYAHGQSLRHILDKITKWHFLRTSNEVIWPKKFFNSMHGLKSAILAILPEIGRLAGLACLVSATLHFRPLRMTGNGCISFYQSSMN